MSTAPFLFVTHLVAPKHGSTEAECEDAVAVLPACTHVDMVREPLTAGICDGATESVLAKDWARLLSGAAATEAMDRPGVLAGGPAFEEFTARAVARWEPWLEEYTRTRADEGRPLKWYEQAKLASGAFATLLVVRVDPEPPTGPGSAWHWQAAALGDSCLFHLRDDRLLSSFPVQRPEDFDTTPDLFSSRNHDTVLLEERTRFADGKALPGDRLLLMTDALAAWFLSAADPTAALHELLDFSGPGDLGAFTRWLTGLREGRLLRNDDVAVVRIDFEGR
ncbi:hypothetical protein [Streptomyces sp. NBC_01408]|uniref:hypothetical protein n=1 Tax=Streptomyces sp. NBC_01408 TaxID=2903855 RepID=UPI002258D96B|nr:hypothetical protein [Streptomyces sp. NBC_01408]MCX4693956.1 hypothetical protein [Streptomyces sp. NBC_01408]